MVATRPGAVPRYRGRVNRLRFTRRPELRRPVLVCAFEGWNDAGEAASAAARYLSERWSLERVAELDAEDFFDFTATRPEVRIDPDGERRIRWPVTELWAGSTGAAPARDVAVLTGPEPALRWRAYTDEVVALAASIGTPLVVLLGALLAEVPHSRPVPVNGSASDPDIGAELGLRRSAYEGPTGMVGVLDAALTEAGVPTVSLWAAVPSYVPAASSPVAALALVERVAALLDAPVATVDLQIAAAAYERQVGELVEADEETSTYVAELERRHDADESYDDDSDSPDDGPLDGVALVEEVERYLRSRSDGT